MKHDDDVSVSESILNETNTTVFRLLFKKGMYLSETEKFRQWMQKNI